MKKVLAVLMAVLMTMSMFSVAFVAMAEDAPEPEETTQAEEEGGFSLEDLENLPFWEVKGAAKVLKIVVKLALKLGKILIKLGIVDTQDIVDWVTNLIGNIGGEEETTAPVDVTEAPEVTDPVAG